MARGDEPLLSHRASSEQSYERDLAEEDALLTGERADQSSSARWKLWREIGLFTWALLATAIVIVLAVLYERQSSTADPLPVKATGKRNLIFMVSDGMGPTSLSMTRSFRQHALGLPWDDTLVLDKHLIGQSRTRSTSSLVTDSAAGATAFSCGKKSYNGAISILPDRSACGTVLEAAKKAGYMTGLVVTTRITDATPAVFAAHAFSRAQEDLIAEQMVGKHPLGRVVDLMLGGGRCHFLPQGVEGSCRDDDTDVVAMAREKGFNYVDDRAGFDSLKGGKAVQLPLLGLFANRDIPFEVDRRYENDAYPSLEEMARTAMRALSAATADSDKGFFLMIEGSRIDHAGHGNDPVAQVHEVIAYDQAMASVLEFLEKDDVQGVMVSTSDHETGGLAAARRECFPTPSSSVHFAGADTKVLSTELHDSYPDYLWYPGVLANASHSADYLAHTYHEQLRSAPQRDSAQYLHHLLSDHFGILDASDDEIRQLVGDADSAAYIFADMISRRAQIGWSTHGHSGGFFVYPITPDHATIRPTFIQYSLYLSPPKPLPPKHPTDH